jgi:hypothetical protein
MGTWIEILWGMFFLKSIKGITFALFEFFSIFMITSSLKNSYLTSLIIFLILFRTRYFSDFSWLEHYFWSRNHHQPVDVEDLSSQARLLI